jgi:methylglyoxal synthase
MTIAILAHDSRKELMLQFCTAYVAILAKHTLVATGTTGRLVANATGLPVHCCLSGALGGNQQIIARVACDEVDMVLFFRDPLESITNMNDQTLLRLCDMHNVPIATNIATAEILLRGIDAGDLDYREDLHRVLHTPTPAPVPDESDDVSPHLVVC